MVTSDSICLYVPGMAFKQFHLRELPVVLWYRTQATCTCSGFHTALWLHLHSKV